MLKKIYFVAITMFLIGLLFGCSKKEAPRLTYAQVFGEDPVEEKSTISPASDFQVSLTTDGTGAVISKYVGNSRNVVIPSTIEGLPVKEIGDEAFRDSSVSQVTFPSSLEKIGEFAFNGCENLTSIVIPDSVNSIGREAFAHTTALGVVTFPSSNIEIDYGAFHHSGLKNVTITENMIFPKGYYSYGSGMSYIFAYCDNLETLTIGDGVEKLPNILVSSNTLKNVIFKDSKTTVMTSTFVSCPNLSLAVQAELKQRER